MSTPTASTPVADARMLGLAHYAARGVLERVLTKHGLTFQQHVALRAAVAAEPSTSPAKLAAQIQQSLKADPGEAVAILDDLITRDLLTVGQDGIAPSASGQALFEAAGAQAAPIVARVWAGIEPDDLVAAGRVLTLVTEHANTELQLLPGA